MPLRSVVKERISSVVVKKGPRYVPIHIPVANVVVNLYSLYNLHFLHNLSDYRQQIGIKLAALKAKPATSVTAINALLSWLYHCVKGMTFQAMPSTAVLCKLILKARGLLINIVDFWLGCSIFSVGLV